ncbi:globin domain-containing protein [Micromonospora sp. WMMD1128]|uniref:globin domain-containing protein n=1 Tax=unclassified Micromonospora TaxID=2617518 RepID=UPI00248C981A|nr:MULTISPECIES: globin domain-containing protein [unclassified Micromonospora]WBB76489.1 globin domain-containing protein [Micromonospora sp. WMMD1128]WFE35727.1 globin domain-containing protein [Micromonospora sp. WMMD975]
MDAARLKQSWALVAGHGDQVPLYFYSTLFLAHPETRQMFGTDMAGQRDRLVSALGHIVSHVDQVDLLVGFLRQLGADHRKYAVRAEHYPAVGEALVATLRHFSGAAWTDELAADWVAAYGLVARVMTEAAQAAEAHSPPWWVGEVLVHERRTFDVAVLTVRPQYLLPFTAGQSIGVSHPAVRSWRYYSPANAPRADGTVELHVRAAPGGAVSSRLVYGCAEGDQIHLAAPVGDGLALWSAGSSDLLLLAGGTGWAPVKALVEQVAAEGSGRRVDLYVGARSRTEFYDSEAIDKLAAQHPWLRVSYVSGGDPRRPGEVTPVVDRVLAEGDWRSRHVYVCGSDEMVSQSVAALTGAGYAPGQVHHEGYGKHWYGPTWRTATIPDGGIR